MLRLALIGTLVVLGVLPGAATAAPTWLAPAPISAAGEGAGGAQVAVAGDGSVLAAWLRPVGASAVVEARLRPPGGALGPVETLSGVGADQLALAMAADGTAVALWRRGGRVEAAVRPPGGTFGTAQAISPAAETARDPQIAIGGAGTATAAWASTEGDTDRIRVATRPPAGDWGAPVEIDSRTDTLSSGTGEARTLDQPRIAADPSGRAYLAFRSFDTQWIGGTPQSTAYFAQLRVRQPGEAFGPPFNPSPHSGPIDDFAIAAGPDGTAAFAWADRSADRLAVRVRPPQGPFGPLEAPVDLPSGSTEPRLPDVAVYGAGNVAVVWLRDTLGGDDSVGADVRPAGSFFPSDPQTLSDPSLNVRLPRLAVDGTGAIHVAWHRREGIPVLVASRRAPGGAFSPPAPISGPGQSSLDPQGLQLAGDDEGNAVAVWARNHEGGDRIELAALDGAGPRLGGVSIPASGSLFEPLAFSVSPFDVWSPVTSVAWDLGDGGTAAGATVSHAYTDVGSHAVSVTATDAVGNATTASGAAEIADTAEPRLRLLALRPPRFRVGRRPTPRFGVAQHARRRARVGTLVRYRLSEDARVVFAIRRARPGRRIPARGRQRCVRPTRRLVRRGARRCVRFKTVARLVRVSNAGGNRFRFTGRIRRRPLPPGRYRLAARARDGAGNRSPLRQRGFAVLRH